LWVLCGTKHLYYVVDDTVTTLADGSQIVHSYGNEQALSAIAEGQSGLFKTSFNDVFLAGEISALTLAPLLALGGGGLVVVTVAVIILAPTLAHGTNGNDTIDGGAGNDILYGAAGKDTFKYKNDSQTIDIIRDFQVGTGTGADVLDLAALLNYNLGDNINDFIKVFDSGRNTTLEFYVNGGMNIAPFGQKIELEGVTGVSLSDMINDGNIVLF